MRIFESIYNIIRFGVLLLRTKKIEVDVEAGGRGKPAPLTPEEVDAMLTEAAKAVPEAKNWRTSIVDLMKVLHLDSSLSVRATLARELGYRGDYTGEAEQNIWLHDQVMQQVANRAFNRPA
jgi:hypothetical protein